jgi:hypothetical protein
VEMDARRIAKIRVEKVEGAPAEAE